MIIIPAMDRPFFSVIIPVYNRPEFIRTAIESVLSQTFPGFELIVVDDGSTDKTPEVIHSFNDSRLRCLRREHRGVAAARNHGLRQANGEFIAFLDSDDRFRKDKLEITSRYIREHPDISIFHTEEIWYLRGKLLNQKNRHRKPDGLVFERALGLCCISISTAAARKNVFAEIGTFDETMPACEDYDFWLRAAAKYPVKLIPEFLTIKEGGHADQLSRKYEAMDKFRIYALKKLLDSGTLNEKQFQAAGQELRRKCAIYINGAAKRKKVKEARFYAQIMHAYEEA